MDLALVTFVFLGIGYGLDRWFGTRPVFIICFVLLALVGQFARMKYAYDATMRLHEQERGRMPHRDSERAA
jgi:F0F1-type ATP synthase assembly protein I